MSVMTSSFAVMPMMEDSGFTKLAIAAFRRAEYRSNDLIPTHEAMPEKARLFPFWSSPGDPMP